ncbi:hypothetical protein CaCOL14_000819 [Colletotrichum acutatum]
MSDSTNDTPLCNHHPCRALLSSYSSRINDSRIAGVLSPPTAEVFNISTTVYEMAHLSATLSHGEEAATVPNAPNTTRLA